MLLFLAAACAPADQDDPITLFQLDSAELTPEQAAPMLLEQLAAELDASSDAEAGHPAVGSVILLPDPDNPNGNMAECSQEFDRENSSPDCILLNQAGDFVQVTPISYQSAAFHMIRIFVQSGSGEVDFTRDYVAVDVYLMHEPGLWAEVMTAIANAARGVGAQSYQP